MEKRQSKNSYKNCDKMCIRDSYEGLELYPVFALQAEVLHTAAGPMKKHSIMECTTDQGRALYSKEELSEIFLAENRITVSESLL